MFATRLEERQVAVETKLAPGCQVSARENDLRLVLSNVLDNAAGAAPERGKIGVETAQWRVGPSGSPSPA